MKILISNDDGILSPGIMALSEAASAFGEVYVCAPDEQNSAMSHRLTIRKPLTVTAHENFPGAVKAWSVSGTPADAVKLALQMLPFRPDLVLTGINDGYNAGYDILYSATCGAASEALIGGVPAIAWSTNHEPGYATTKLVIRDLLPALISYNPGPGAFYSVNVPALPYEELKGVEYEVPPACVCLKENVYIPPAPGVTEGEWQCTGERISDDRIPAGTDIDLLLKGYVTVSRLKQMPF